MIKTIITIAFIILFKLNSFSQQLNDSLKIEFFNTVFTDYFISNDTLDHDYYILKDSVAYDVKTDYKDFKLHIIDFKQAFQLIRRNEISSIYRISLEQISNDTIDVIISGSTVSCEKVIKLKKVNGKTKLKFRNYYFAKWCGGTLGYIPQGRFVYNAIHDKWNYISEKQIVEDKKKKYNYK